VLEAIRSSSNPEQAARLLRSFLGRFPSSDAFASLFAGEAGAARRFITVLGASAFVGEAFVARPDLADVVLFGRGTPTVDEAIRAVEEAIDTFHRQVTSETEPLDRRDVFIGALRRAQRRMVVEVAVALGIGCGRAPLARQPSYLGGGSTCRQGGRVITKRAPGPSAGR
jgi:glutamine synthetase adenylyltransferase